MTGYLTPDTVPADTICRVLFIPNNREFIANVTGALQVLINPDSWTEYGTLTPQESANALVDMFDQFCFGEGSCHMIGEIILWAGDDPPADNVLLCDGTEYLRADYPTLYDRVGAVFHVDADHFTVPDLSARVAIGANTDFPLGNAGGSTEHTLTTAEMPSHTHTDTGHVHSAELSTISAAEIPVVPVPVALVGVGSTGVGSASLTSTGGDTPHSLMQPYLPLNYYIVAL